jgi:hypothetical protein
VANAGTANTPSSSHVSLRDAHQHVLEQIRGLLKSIGDHVA